MSVDEQRLRQLDADIDLKLGIQQKSSSKNKSGLPPLTPYQIKQKRLCKQSCLHFITYYCKIYEANTPSDSGQIISEITGSWIPFVLWKEQIETLDNFINCLLCVVLKARQLGLTWLALAFALWLMIFKPAATILVFSKRDDEAQYLLGNERLRGMYRELPEWLKRDITEVKMDGHVWTLSNGSTAKAFPTTGGDSYTATLAIVDEADLIPNLDRLMGSVKPTIDAGGRMLLISRTDKSKPQSYFKKIYIAAREGIMKNWKAIFLPWNIRPERTQDWYEEQAREMLEATGSLDDLYERYPATDAEALAPRSLDKRFAPAHLLSCYRSRKPFTNEELLKIACPALPNLRLYVPPKPYRQYVVGIDPAEGNPKSHDSAIQILDWETGEQCAVLAGKQEPQTTAGYADILGTFYNQADVLVLRNNHGHVVIHEMKGTRKLTLIKGQDNKLGWPENNRTKTFMMDNAADSFRDADCVIYDFPTYTQLTSIEGSTLKAPEGEPDDLADAHVTALLARVLKVFTPAEKRSYLNTEVDNRFLQDGYDRSRDPWEENYGQSSV